MRDISSSASQTFNLLFLWLLCATRSVPNTIKINTVTHQRCDCRDTLWHYQIGAQHIKNQPSHTPKMRLQRHSLALLDRCPTYKKSTKVTHQRRDCRDSDSALWGINNPNKKNLESHLHLTSVSRITQICFCKFLQIWYTLIHNTSV